MFICLSVAVAALYWNRPHVLVYITAGLVCLSLPRPLPASLSFAGQTFRLYEPFLLLTAAFVLLSTSRRRRSDRAAGLIAAVVVVWALLGLLRGNPFDRVTTDVRQLLYLAIAVFVAGRLANTGLLRQTSKAVRIALWISATVTAAASASIVQVAGRAVEIGSSGDEAIRLLTPATYPSLAVLLVIIGMAITGWASPAKTWSYWIPALVIVFLSFSRNNIIAIAVTLAFLLLAVGAKKWLRKIIIAIGALSIVSLLIYLALPNLRLLPVFDWIETQADGYRSQVLDGLSTSAISTDSSAQYRLQEENPYMLEAIQQSPVFGHGFGYAYRPLSTGRSATLADVSLRYYAHNYYLWILVKAGIFGAIMTLAVFFAPLWIAWRSKARAAVCSAAAVAGLLACSVVVPMPNGAPTAVVLGLLVGYSLVIREATHFGVETPIECFNSDSSESSDLEKSFESRSLREMKNSTTTKISLRDRDGSSASSP